MPWKNKDDERRYREKYRKTENYRQSIKRYYDNHKDEINTRQRLRQKSDRQKNPERYREYQRKWRRNNREQRNKAEREYRHRNIERVRAYQRAYYHKFKKEKGYYKPLSSRVFRYRLLDLLGSFCILCRYTDKRALQIDHKNGGGTAEAKKFHGHNNMINYYLRHPNEAKEKLQVLCANCNWIKKDVNQEHGKRFLNTQT